MADRVSDWLSQVSECKCDINDSLEDSPPAERLCRKRKLEDSLEMETRESAAMDESDFPTPKRPAGRGRALQSEQFELPPSPRTTISDRPRRAESQASISASSQSGRSSRDSSPTKRKFDLLISYPTVKFETSPATVPNVQGAKMGKELVDLLLQTQNSVPLALKAELENKLDPFRESPPLYSDDPKYKHRSQELWKLVTEIVAGTIECHSKELPEEEWSDQVVLPILRHATRRLDQPDILKTRSVKGIDVKPRNLLPTGHFDKNIGPKKVDYAFILEMQDEDSAIAALRRLGRNGIQSLSQAEHPMLRPVTTFSALEIKTQYNPTSPEVQIGIWCAAGFKRLQTIIEARDNVGPTSRPPGAPFPEMPVMPLWLVRDDVWSLYVGSQQSADRIIIHGPLKTWSTQSHLESLRLTLSVTAVMQWGIEVYRPWFLDQINSLYD